MGEPRAASPSRGEADSEVAERPKRWKISAEFKAPDAREADE